MIYFVWFLLYCLSSYVVYWIFSLLVFSLSSDINHERREARKGFFLAPLLWWIPVLVYLDMCQPAQLLLDKLFGKIE